MMPASTVFLLALSMLCVSIFRPLDQLSAAANVGAMVAALRFQPTDAKVWAA